MLPQAENDLRASLRECVDTILRGHLRTHVIQGATRDSDSGEWHYYTLRYEPLMTPEGQSDDAAS